MCAYYLHCVFTVFIYPILFKITTFCIYFTWVLLFEIASSADVFHTNKQRWAYKSTCVSLTFVILVVIAVTVVLCSRALTHICYSIAGVGD